jgi:transposase
MKISFSIKQRQELETAHRAEREAHFSDRLKAILCLDRGMNYEEVGDLLLCNNRSVRRYEERYLTGGIDALLSDERGGSNGRLNNQHIEDLRGELKGKAYQSSKTVRAIIEAKFGVSYALSSVRELLSRMGFVYTGQIHGPQTVALLSISIRNCGSIDAHRFILVLIF